MSAVFAAEAIDAIEVSARTVLAACSGDEAPVVAAHKPVNTIPLRRKIAGRLIQSGRYVV